MLLAVSPGGTADAGAAVLVVRCSGASGRRQPGGREGCRTVRQPGCPAPMIDAWALSLDRKDFALAGGPQPGDLPLSFVREVMDSSDPALAIRFSGQSGAAQLT